MKTKTKYIITNILDYVFTYGGTAGVVIYNCIAPDNSLGFKLSLGGIVILIALIFAMKSMFEKSFRRTYDTLLQQLAEATDDTKPAITKELESFKTKKNILDRIVVLMPFIVLYLFTLIGQVSFESLNGTVGFVLLSMGIGSVFNVIKKPLQEKYSLEKITKKEQ